LEIWGSEGGGDGDGDGRSEQEGRRRRKERGKKINKDEMSRFSRNRK
jgi:hypothetical protein